VCLFHEARGFEAKERGGLRAVGEGDAVGVIAGQALEAVVL
jgi:hypothetical protein